MAVRGKDCIPGSRFRSSHTITLKHPYKLDHRPVKVFSLARQQACYQSCLLLRAHSFWTLGWDGHLQNHPSTPRKEFLVYTGHWKLLGMVQLTSARCSRSAGWLWCGTDWWWASSWCNWCRAKCHSFPPLSLPPKCCVLMGPGAKVSQLSTQSSCYASKAAPVSPPAETHLHGSRRARSGVCSIHIWALPLTRDSWVPRDRLIAEGNKVI